MVTFRKFGGGGGGGGGGQWEGRGADTFRD